MSGVISRISAIVLAAGMSKRMGENKLLLDFKGKPLLSHTLELVAHLDFKEKILVTTDEMAKSVSIPDGFKTVINEEPNAGQSMSLKLGVESAIGEYYMFFLGDMPLLDEALIYALVDAIGDARDSIIIPETSGKPANPVIFPKALRRELLALNGDSGGRQIIKTRAGQCRIVRFERSAAFLDIDTPEDYAGLKQITMNN